MIGVVGKILLALAVAPLVACASGTATFKSRGNLAGATQIDHLLVVNDNIESRGFNADMYRGFAIGLTQRLDACRVRSSILQSSGYSTESRLNDAIRETDPNAVLIIEPEGGSNVINRSSGVVTSQLYFELKLIDVKLQRITWLATVMLDVSSNGWVLDDPASGLRFATSIVAQLRQDHVLKLCPPPATPWPDVKLDPPRPSVASS